MPLTPSIMASKNPSGNLDDRLSEIYKTDVSSGEPQEPHEKPLYSEDGTFNFDETCHMEEILDLAHKAGSLSAIKAFRSMLARSMEKYTEKRRSGLYYIFKEEGLYDLLREKEARLSQASQKRAAKREAQERERESMPGVFIWTEVFGTRVELFVGYSRKSSAIVRVQRVMGKCRGLNEGATYKADLSNAPQALKDTLKVDEVNIDELLEKAAEKRDALKAQADHGKVVAA